MVGYTGGKGKTFLFVSLHSEQHILAIGRWYAQGRMSVPISSSVNA